MEATLSITMVMVDLPSYDGGSKGGSRGGGSIMYGSTVGYGGGFTIGDGTYTMPPLVLSAPKSYQGNSALTGLILSMGIQQHLATYLGYKQESYVYRGPENGQGGGIIMMDSMWDALGIVIANNMSSENKTAMFGLGALAIILSKGKATDEVLKAETKIIRTETSIAKTQLMAEKEVISSSDFLRIENAASRINKPITVVGSRASSTAKAYSDWDYVIEGLNSKEWSKIKNSIPGARSTIDNTPRNIDIFKTLDLSRPYLTIHPR